MTELTHQQAVNYAAALEMAQALKTAKMERRLELEYAGIASEGHVGGPYDWQKAFHDAGSKYPQRGIIAANRSGKTRTVGAECAIHLTGRYPSWWTGRRWDRPVIGVVAGQTNEDVRNVQQLELFGEVKERKLTGTGWVPKHDILRHTFRQCGVPNVLDTVTVKHISGGESQVMLKSYEQGAAKFQGFQCDFMWHDEEPTDWMIFTESLARLLDRKGMFMISRTPLLGMTDIIKHFVEDETPATWFITATWDESPHLDDEAKEAILATCKPHERNARAKGIPMMGSGLVYQVPEDDISCTPFPIPSHFRRVCGVDIGFDHPTAIVWLAYDPDGDIIYIYDCHRASGEQVAYHAEAIKARGDWIPVAMPHDADNVERGGGSPVRSQYEDHGVRTIPISARYDDDKGGGQPREPQILANLERMKTGRFRVFNFLDSWFKEFRMYHRKDGKIVSVGEDLMSATNYAAMMLRYAVSQIEAVTPRSARATGASYDPLER